MKKTDERKKADEKPARQTSEAKRRRRQEKEEKLNFLRKVKNAPSGRAMLTEKTGAYYRFSKKYPRERDENGFMTNGKPSSGKKKIYTALAAVLCVLAFTLGVLLTDTGILLSGTEPEDSAPEKDTKKSEYIIPFDYDAWASSDKQTLYDGWKKDGVTGLMLTVKAPDGTLPFALEGEALKTAANELKLAGFDTAAYISCFKDTTYANAFPGRAVQIKDTGGAVLYSDGYAYINPFSEEGVNYVTDIITAAAQTDFTYIILDEITLPVNTAEKTPYYEGYTGAQMELNTTLNACVRKFSMAAGSARVIFTTDVYGFYNTDNITGMRYEGRLFPKICKLRGVDVRLSCQNITGKDPLKLIDYIRTVPTVFILEAVTQAVAETPANIPLYALIDSAADAPSVRSAGVDRIIVTGGK